MDDQQIIQCYWDRDETAIPLTADKYGRYCTAIARNILISPEDTEECVNDTWLQAWNSMPPHRPTRLATFLGKLTRNLSLHRYERNHAAKRGGGELPLILDELGDCVSGADDTALQYDQRELLRALNMFLAKLPEKKRRIFVCRYWYADPLAEIAAQTGMTVSGVAMVLQRTRQKLRIYLTERGFSL